MGHQTIEEKYLTHQTIGKKNRWLKMENWRSLWWKYGSVRPQLSLLLIVEVRKPFAKGFTQFWWRDISVVCYLLLLLLLIVVCFFVCLLVVCRNFLQNVLLVCDKICYQRSPTFTRRYRVVPDAWRLITFGNTCNIWRTIQTITIGTGKFTTRSIMITTTAHAQGTPLVYH